MHTGADTPPYPSNRFLLGMLATAPTCSAYGRFCAVPDRAEPWLRPGRVQGGPQEGVQTGETPLDVPFETCQHPPSPLVAGPARRRGAVLGASKSRLRSLRQWLPLTNGRPRPAWRARLWCSCCPTARSCARHSWRTSTTCSTAARCAIAVRPARVCAQILPGMPCFERGQLLMCACLRSRVTPRQPLHMPPTRKHALLHRYLVCLRPTRRKPSSQMSGSGSHRAASTPAARAAGRRSSTACATTCTSCSP